MKKKSLIALLMLIVLGVSSSVAFSATSSGVDNPAAWAFTLVSSGEDASWVSTTRVNPAYFAYGYSCEITQFDLELDTLGFQSYLGEMDPNSDISDYDGLPSIVTYAAYDSNGLAANFNVWVDEDGYAHAEIIDITFSQWGGLDVIGLEISGTINAIGLRNLWSDDFSSYADESYLGDAADWETTRDDGGNEVFKIKSTHGKCVEYRNGYWGGYPEKALATGSYGSYDQQSFRAKVEGKPWWPEEPYVGLYWYVMGRVTNNGHFRVKAALDSNSGTTRLYVRLLDTEGYDSLDYYVADFDPAEPIVVELEVEGNEVTGRVIHAGKAASITYTTTITGEGDVAMAGEWPWGYAVGFFDNFEVYSNSAVAPETCGDQGTIYLEGDINEDCRVDFYDLSDFAGDWLKTGDASIE